MTQRVDVLVIGAGASGLMCAAEAGKRQRKVLVLDHANKAGKKILMSGGGRCNFTNRSVAADNYLSRNPHFCKSALSRYSQWDFLALVQQYEISYHERSHGQLFCDNSAKDILNMLLSECRCAGVTIRLNSAVDSIVKQSDGWFALHSSDGEILSRSVVIASGGLSIPRMGATPFGYKIARQFAVNVWPTVAALVPFTLQPHDKERLSYLSGIAVDSVVSHAQQSFRDNILFTHRGLSGPAILQISSYWQPGEAIEINLLPDCQLQDELLVAQQQRPQRRLKSVLAHYLPKRVVAAFVADELLDQPLQTMSRSQMCSVANLFHRWSIKPNGTEGYRTAEVTAGGVDCDALSSKTMECREVPGLYFIGEVVDVTGWLGGYNFQWAWSSAWCAGQYV
ncbi:MAG: NAD(P)/FAD-dependent oxidoreductase [Gammaproteobacteria bacterium]|nr:NAD(P)/FAD-dependent oxidoreductase [Gammaproteobacteria bacterium]